MAASFPEFSEEERQLLNAHYTFYRELDFELRLPRTEAQRHFVAVCRDKASAQTAHERAYRRFKDAVRTEGVAENDLLAHSVRNCSLSVSGNGCAADDA